MGKVFTKASCMPEVPTRPDPDEGDIVAVSDGSVWIADDQGGLVCIHAGRQYESIGIRLDVDELKDDSNNWSINPAGASITISCR